jgi:hypothetical protein
MAIATKYQAHKPAAVAEHPRALSPPKGFVALHSHRYGARRFGHYTWSASSQDWAETGSSAQVDWLLSYNPAGLLVDDLHVPTVLDERQILETDDSRQRCRHPVFTLPPPRPTGTSQTADRRIRWVASILGDLSLARESCPNRWSAHKRPLKARRVSRGGWEEVFF